MDTIHLEIKNSQLNPVVCEGLTQNNNVFIFGAWLVKAAHLPRHDGGPMTFRFKAIHEEKGICVKGTNWNIEIAEFSLPRVLFGTNGTQIRTQAQLDQAFETARRHISEISMQQIEFGEIRRLDVACNIRCNARAVLAALKDAAVRRVRKDRCEFRDNGIQIRGKLFTFQVYSKVAERRSKVGLPYNGELPRGLSTLRVELQAKTRASMRATFGENIFTPVTKVTLKQAWEALYAFTIQIKLATNPEYPCEKAVLIALLERNGVRFPNGESPLDWCIRNLKPESARRLRRKVADVRFEGEAISFRDLLSENGPTEFIDIDDDGNDSGALAVV